MIEAQFTYFDMVVIGIMFLSCLFAFFRGFVREVLSLAAWVSAGVITIVYYKSAGHMLEPHFKKPEMAAIVASFCLYVGTLVFFAIFNSYIIKVLKSGSSLGIMDNFLGLIFGGLRGALIISLGYFLITATISEKKQPEWLEKSITRPLAAKGAIMLAEMAPNYLRDISKYQKKSTDDLKSEIIKEPENEEKKPTPQTLDEIIKHIDKNNKGQ